MGSGRRAVSSVSRSFVAGRDLEQHRLAARRTPQRHGDRQPVHQRRRHGDQRVARHGRRLRARPPVVLGVDQVDRDRRVVRRREQRVQVVLAEHCVDPVVAAVRQTRRPRLEILRGTRGWGVERFFEELLAEVGQLVLGMSEVERNDLGQRAWCPRRSRRQVGRQTGLQLRQQHGQLVVGLVVDHRLQVCRVDDRGARRGEQLDRVLRRSVSQPAVAPEVPTGKPNPLASKTPWLGVRRIVGPVVGKDCQHLSGLPDRHRERTCSVLRARDGHDAVARQQADRRFHPDAAVEGRGTGDRAVGLRADRVRRQARRHRCAAS